jgi:hypothetical protein
MAIDADYKTALEDLVKVQWQLQKHAVEAALEKSKRGGHLWIFFETPVLARDARIYIYHVAAKLDVQIKGAGLARFSHTLSRSGQKRRRGRVWTGKQALGRSQSGKSASSRRAIASGAADKAVFRRQFSRRTLKNPFFDLAVCLLGLAKMPLAF